MLIAKIINKDGMYVKSELPFGTGMRIDTVKEIIYEDEKKRQYRFVLDESKGDKIMAKLHKVEMYILDLDEHYGSLKDTIDHINDRLQLVSLHPFNVQTVELDWHDEHKLNFSNASYDDYSGFFPKKSEGDEG